MSWIHSIPWDTISYIGNGLLMIAIAFMILILKGIMASREQMVADYKRRNLSGREREEIRRRLLSQGIGGVHPHEVLDLIYSFRAVELGQYRDSDPYVPDDPYDDLDEYESGKPH